ncbi:ferric reductase-like transmembrane domain-containing protein [Desulfolutivibrio sp.]|uniref:ferric reductase-like transmembrane domain-containing protein n=1 Tax=Desulfolutivibrio sp. TaxID=2773296 RepID=UPI002F969A4F
MTRLRATIFFLAPMGLACAALALALALPQVFAGEDRLRAVANLAALTALTCIPLLFLLGARSPLAVQALGLPRTFRVHKALGLAFPALLAVHAGLHVFRFARAMGLSFPQAALDVPNTWEMVLGKAALALFFAAWGAAWLGTSGRLPRRIWRPVHLAAYLAAPAAFVHALFRGEDMTRGWLFAVWIVAAATWLMAVGWRALRARSAPY